jgi:polyferredoxin
MVSENNNTIKIIAFACLCLFVFFELFFLKFSFHPAGYVGSLLLIFFGLWRIDTEKNPFQKARIITIVSLYSLFWLIIPLGFGVKVPILGGEWGQFPGLHIVGSLVFFIYFGVVLLFGRRVDCGWCCPCVTARETIGYPFRDKTVRSSLWWRLRHLKFVLLGLLFVYLAFMLIDARRAYDRAGKYFYDIITYGYYGSFLLIPLTGNRNFCRILCPYAGLWGLLSVIGFYRIRARRETCIGCRACEAVCDMGIPIARLVQEKGEVRSAECMGCGRCVSACPQHVLATYSFGGFVKQSVMRIIKRLGAQRTMNGRRGENRTVS